MLFKTGLVSGLAMTLTLIGSNMSNSHDLEGAITERNLPEEILEALDEAERLRDPELREEIMSLGGLPDADRSEKLSTLGLSTDYETALEGIFRASAKWPKGYKITVCFFDGSQVARSNVVEVASEVFSAAKLKMDVGDVEDIRTCSTHKKSMIRVAFGTDGNWSYVGTDALKIPQNRPTLGLENFHQFSNLSERRKGTVRHEFMHAIGALHEHQHPEADCEEDFNWDVIYESLPWPKNKIDRNLRRITKTKAIALTDYDPKSNMHYSLPKHYFKNGGASNCYVKKNSKLSQGDLEIIKKLYH